MFCNLCYTQCKAPMSALWERFKSLQILAKLSNQHCCPSHHIFAVLIFTLSAYTRLYTRSGYPMCFHQRYTLHAESFHPSFHVTKRTNSSAFRKLSIQRVNDLHAAQSVHYQLKFRTRLLTAFSSLRDCTNRDTLAPLAKLLLMTNS